jgi:isoleucyl-tRNA synthetase
VLDDGAPLELSAEEIIVNQSPSAGWTVASDGAETVALDLELNADLRRRGLVREIVRDIQEARKNAGFDVSDRIELHWQVGGGAEPAEAMTAHAGEVAAEVLATTFMHGRPADAPEVDVEGVIPPGVAATADGWAVAVDADLGLVVWLRRARA